MIDTVHVRLRREDWARFRELLAGTEASTMAVFHQLVRLLEDDDIRDVIVSDAVCDSYHRARRVTA